MHPYNDINVIEGNSTAAMELPRGLSRFRCHFCSVGGGGHSGTCLATKYFSNAKVYGAEPEGADDAYRSFSKERLFRW